jgi:hypothetical protein
VELGAILAEFAKQSLQRTPSNSFEETHAKSLKTPDAKIVSIFLELIQFDDNDER